MGVSRTLKAQGVPRWLRLLVKGLLVSSSARVVSGSSTSSIAMLIARGVKHGCPASGSLWALSFHPIIRTASCSMLSVGGSLGIFADDMACAIRNIILSISGLAPNLSHEKLVEDLGHQLWHCAG